MLQKTKEAIQNFQDQLDKILPSTARVDITIHDVPVSEMEECNICSLETGIYAHESGRSFSIWSKEIIDQQLTLKPQS